MNADDKNRLLAKLCALPSYDLEPYGYMGHRLEKLPPVDVNYFQSWGELSGEWLKAEEVVKFLKDNGLI